MPGSGGVGDMLSMTLKPVAGKDIKADKRKLRRWTKEGLKYALEYWAKKFLRLHFTQHAYVRYPGVYKRRQYRRRTRRGLFGSQSEVVRDLRPLYETGLSRLVALGNVRISGRGKLGPEFVGAQVKVQAHMHLTYLKKRGIYDPEKEITAVNRKELQVLAQIVDKYVHAQLSRDVGAVAAVVYPIKEMTGFYRAPIA